MIVYSEPRALEEVPLVDLSAPQDEIVSRIAQACRDIGFFYAVNHGVPQDLIDAQFDRSHRFFDLHDAAKLSLHMRKAPSKSGYEPIEGQQLDSWDENSEAAPPT